MAKRRRNPRKGTSPIALRARKREEEAVNLRLEGKTLEEIAAAVGYESRNGAFLAILRAKARLAPVKDSEELRQQDIAATYEIQQEAMEQWHRSTKDAIKEAVKEKAIESDGDTPNKGVEIEKTTTREGQTGNPALLDKALKAMERRAKMLGLDAPERSKVELAGQVDLFGVDRAKLLQRHLDRLRKGKKDAGL